MTSLFPGIDPYVEATGAWPDFHVTFMNAWRDEIVRRLPDDYIARLEEQLTIIEYEEDREQRRSPDIIVAKSSGSRSSGGLAVAEPTAHVAPQLNRINYHPELRQAEIRIHRLPDLTLVAVLQLLTPDNKNGDGRVQYKAKRQQVLLSEAHLVELDLLVGGKRLPFAEPIGPAHFYAAISRSGQRPTCEVYSWNLDQPLPELPIPLHAPDRDIEVPLAEVLATTYERGRYGKTIKYSAPVELPLTDAYHGWVKGQVTSAAHIGGKHA